MTNKKPAADEPQESSNEAAAKSAADAKAVADAEAIIADAAETIEEVPPAEPLSPLETAEASAAEHLNDLQRLQAEFVNYRKRVDRDRAQVSEFAAAKVIESLIPVLDDVYAARDHKELEGPFAAIADKLEAALERLGWSSYGAEGEHFDPAVHEALVSTPEEGVKEPTIKQVAQPGHKLGDKVLRPARVIVAQPE